MGKEAGFGAARRGVTLGLWTTISLRTEGMDAKRRWFCGFNSGHKRMASRSRYGDGHAKQKARARDGQATRATARDDRLRLGSGMVEGMAKRSISMSLGAFEAMEGRAKASRMCEGPKG